MGNELALPKVQVIENGVPVSTERIDPSVMQFIMQAAQTSQLVRMRKLEESKIPTGIAALSRNVTDVTAEIGLYPAWISFSLVNDGPGAVTVWINDDPDPLYEGMVASNEPLECDMKYPVIRAINIRAVAGTTAAVRIYGKKGGS